MPDNFFDDIKIDSLEAVDALNQKILEIPIYLQHLKNSIIQIFDAVREAHEKDECCCHEDELFERIFSIKTALDKLNMGGLD